MAGYRLYFLDPNNHIRDVVEITCETDDEAIALVEKHTDGRTIELWQEARNVRRFEAAAQGPGAPHTQEQHATSA